MAAGASNDLSIMQISALRDATRIRKLCDEFGRDEKTIKKIAQAFGVSDDELRASLYTIQGRDRGEKTLQKFKEHIDKPVNQLPSSELK